MPRSKEQFKEMREKTRALILEKALYLFANKGFHGTSISDIAKEAGISKGLAYNYFDSKQHIVAALFEQVMEVSAYFENLVDEIKDPFELIEKIIKDTFDFIKQNEKYWRLYFSFSMQPGVLEKGQEMTNEFNVRIIKKIEKIFKKIGFKNAYLEARYFGAIFDGMALNYFYDKENFPLEKFKKLFLKKYSREELEKNL